MRYKVTIARAALDEHPEVFTFDSYYDAQDCIFAKAAEVYGIPVADDEFEQFMELVRFQEVE
jgi:hypothetical protein